MMRLALPAPLRTTLDAGGLSLIVTGAGGWIGRATLEMLAEALGPAGFARRVRAFASSARRLALMNGIEAEIAPLPALAEIEPGPCLLLHYAFLGREKTATMALADYVAANQAIGAIVRRAVARLKPRGLFLSSSGAVYGPGRALEEDLARNPYGAMKLRDEAAFAGACADVGARLVVARIFNLAGAYINKLDGYALACFIRDALAGRPIAIRANRPVVRSFVHVGDVVSLALALLLDPQAGNAAFDTAGEREVEMGELAALAARIAAGRALPIERPPLDPALPAERYVGDPAALRALAARHAIAFEPLEDQVRRTADYLRAAEG